MSNQNLTYGVDFGTTNSTVALFKSSNEAEIIDIDFLAGDPSIVRSVIYVSPEHEFLFGASAIERYLAEIKEGKPWETEQIATGKFISVAKPCGTSGYKGEELVPEIIEVEINLGGRLFQSLKTALASSVVNSFNLFGKEYLLEELIGKFLGELKTKADKVVGQNVKQLVLGRPVHFIGENDELAEKRLHKAATLAGFEKIVFELEPVGAAWDWFSKNSLKRQKILVFDFGGGTLDFTIVSFPEKIVLANGGLPIGGDLFNSEIFDTRLSAYFGRGATFSDKNLNFPPSIFQQLKNWHAISMLKTRKFMNTIDSLSYKCSDETALKALKSLLFDSLGFMLYQDIDWLKKQLSYKDMERLEFRVKDIDINEIISRADFEKMINMYLEQIEKGIDLVLLEAGIGKEKIGLVVTTGGSSLIPIVRILLEQKFGEEKIKSMQAFTSVAYGLALRAGELF